MLNGFWKLTWVETKVFMREPMGFLIPLAMPVILFIFLDFWSAFWVAAGIPFTVGFTLITASLMGHTINGTTLAAVIIVMGMIVDDAIIVAEHVTRLIAQGWDRVKAAVEGTSYVFLPIIAAITTTCATAASQLSTVIAARMAIVARSRSAASERAMLQTASATIATAASLRPCSHASSSTEPMALTPKCRSSYSRSAP